MNGAAVQNPNGTWSVVGFNVNIHLCFTLPGGQRLTPQVIETLQQAGPGIARKRWGVVARTFATRAECEQAIIDNPLSL